MKQEFEITQEEMNDIISINKNQSPVMKFGNYWSGMDLQEKINHYWETLGNKYGFKHLTVEPSSRGRLFFLAEPKPIEKPKTDIDKSIDKYVSESMGYLNTHVKDSLGKIVKQLESCDYESQAGYLSNNIAFLALKKLSNNE